MKQRILLLVAMLLVAAPAFAAVNITVTQGVADPCKLTVSYTCTGSPADKARAFALELTLGSPGNSMTFGEINDFNRGESNKPGGGYGIFPGQFRNNIDPANPNWFGQYYYPVAPSNDVDSNDQGIGNRKIIVELGTLYKDSNAPGASGTLFTIRVDPNGKTINNLHVALNNIRGGVVLENGNPASTNLPTDQNITIAASECFPASDGNYAEWLAIGKPTSWCGDPVAGNYRQCHGDADLNYQTVGKLNYYVSTNDLTVLAAGWQQAYTNPTANPWISADFDHKQQTVGKLNYRVSTNDLLVLAQYWQQGTVPNDCPHN
jgi:hypothetical protein